MSGMITVVSKQPGAILIRCPRDEIRLVELDDGVLEVSIAGGVCLPFPWSSLTKTEQAQILMDVTSQMEIDVTWEYEIKITAVSLSEFRAMEVKNELRVQSTQQGRPHMYVTLDGDTIEVHDSHGFIGKRTHWQWTRSEGRPS